MVLLLRLPPPTQYDRCRQVDKRQLGVLWPCVVSYAGFRCSLFINDMGL
jgi:hypothetical protein